MLKLTFYFDKKLHKHLFKLPYKDMAWIGLLAIPLFYYMKGLFYMITVFRIKIQRGG